MYASSLCSSRHRFPRSLKYLIKHHLSNRPNDPTPSLVEVAISNRYKDNLNLVWQDNQTEVRQKNYVIDSTEEEKSIKIHQHEQHLLPNNISLCTCTDWFVIVMIGNLSGCASINKSLHPVVNWRISILCSDWWISMAIDCHISDTLLIEDWFVAKTEWPVDSTSKQSAFVWFQQRREVAKALQQDHPHLYSTL